MVLAEKWRIANDDNNVILQFFENREKKKEKTGEMETYEYVENFYYPTVKSALTAFLNKYIKGSDSVSEVLKRINDVETKINNL